MTTQIVASKLNGDIGLAMVETVALAAVGFAGLFLLRADASRGRSVGTVRGVAPRRAGSPEVAVRWRPPAGLLAALLLLPHATLLLLSLRAAQHLDDRGPPSGARLSATTRPLRRSPSACGRSSTRSGWPPRRRRPRSCSGFSRRRRSRPRARRAGARRAPSRALIAAPWALPGTVFAVALAAAFCVDRPCGRRASCWSAPRRSCRSATSCAACPSPGRAAFAGLRQLDPALEEAAASLGARAGRRLTPRRPAAPAPGARARAPASRSCPRSATSSSRSCSTRLDTRPISIEILSSLRLQEIGVAAAYGVLLTALSAAAFLPWGRRA